MMEFLTNVWSRCARKWRRLTSRQRQGLTLAAALLTLAASIALGWLSAVAVLLIAVGLALLGAFLCEISEKPSDWCDRHGRMLLAWAAVLVACFLVAAMMPLMVKVLFWTAVAALAAVLAAVAWQEWQVITAGPGRAAPCPC